MTISRQNIYDNEAFFDNFRELRSSSVNFNDCIETPILLSMLPEVAGKRVLDLGCGMGQHARQYAELGAASVLGVDLSEKMLAYAAEHNGGDRIAYLRMPMEEIDRIEGRFDLVTSSLAFDYIEDFDGLLGKIRARMEEDAAFVFSMSHPMATAWDGAYDRFTRTETGERLYANIRNYTVEGLRRVRWVVDDYECYHRTFSSLVNSLVRAGFRIDECRESDISDEMREKYPDRFGRTVHRPDFVFFRCCADS